MFYTSRLTALKTSYHYVMLQNTKYIDTKSNLESAKLKLSRTKTLYKKLKAFQKYIANIEAEWRDTVTSLVEAEISNCLSCVFPTDGYQVNLKHRVFRGKIHLKTKITSVNLERPLSIKTQGGLLKQLVSFGAILAIMKLKGVKTIYVDEAFSDASKENIIVIGEWLNTVISKDCNLILIVQNRDIITSISKTVVYRFSRSFNNESYIEEVSTWN